LPFDVTVEWAVGNDSLRLRWLGVFEDTGTVPVSSVLRRTLPCLAHVVPQRKFVRLNANTSSNA